MNKAYIETLLDSYFEGLTSLDEEQTLRDYFSKGYVDPAFEIYKPMFQYFEEEGAKARKHEGRNGRGESHSPTRRHQRTIRWTSIAAAACLLLFISLRLTVFQSHKQESSYAYIDGKKYTNTEFVQSQALESLENLTESDDDILSSQIELLDSLFE